MVGWESVPGSRRWRLYAQTGKFENGMIYLPREAHWLGEYKHERGTLPNGKFGDQVDSTSQALGWVNQRFPGWEIFEYRRRES